VLGANSLASLNGNWIFNRWDGTVYGLTDEDLTDLKQNNLSGLLYSYVAGVQSENYLTQTNVIQDFFYPRKFYKNAFYLYNAFYVWDYFRFSTSSSSDSAKVLAPPHEDANPLNRDFAGADLTAWIFDMFSPQAEYTDRARFPEGDGVNRRIGFSDLSSEGHDYLKKQKKLSLLNFLNPAIFLINRIKVNSGFNFIFFTQYSPTHFGNDIALYIPFQLKSSNQLLAFHNYSNNERKFMGFQYGIYNITPNSGKLEMGGTFSIWNQPTDQGFYDESGKSGGAFEINAGYSITNNFSVNLNAGYKTSGWMIGNPYLDQSTAVRIGIRYSVR
jgi:hypothetical protein